MEYVQSLESMNTKTSEKGLQIFMLSDTPDPLSTRTALPKEEGPDFYLHPLDTMKVVFQLEKVLLSE